MGKGQASCTLESVFLSAGKLNGLSLSSSDVLDRVLVCILSQSLSSCVFLFVSNPRFLSLFCQSAFAPYFLQVFAFMYFSGFCGCFLHIAATSAFYPKLLAKCAFVGQNALSCGSNKQTGLASETLFQRSKHFDS